MPLKTPETVRDDITRRLARTWAADLTGQNTSWPHAFTLGTPTKTELQEGFAAFQQQGREWRDWARAHDVTLTIAERRVNGGTQHIPTHVAVPDLHAAARIAGPEWSSRVTRGSQRLTTLRVPGRYPALLAPAHDGEPAHAPLTRLLRAIDGYTDTEFDLLTTVADWFTHHDATGLTPRQVPLEGIHAKWLDSRHPHILTLTGRSTLGLLPRHPARIHLTYLDPDHRARGGRWHDCATVGDTFTPAYQPRVVLLSENKDTAIHFPPTPGGISIERETCSAASALTMGWITGADRLLYWGDIDADGYAILNSYRNGGLDVTSILMDLPTYEAYERYGTNLDRHNQPLTVRDRKPLPHLTAGERAVYERLTDPAHTGHQRIEQERIPLLVARAAI